MLLLIFHCSPIQTEEEIQQLSIPSSKEEEEEEIWPPEESVSRNSFDFVLSPFPVDR